VYTGHFAECHTRQRGTLPSVRTIALGKEPRPGHRYRFFAECSGSDTRQRSTLCRVPYKALDKVPDMGPRWRILCRVLAGRHSAKVTPLPSVVRQTLGKDVVSVTQRRDDCFSLPSTPWHLAKRFAECPRKSTRQRRLCRCIVCRAFFVECHTRQRLYRVFLRLCRVLRALGKAVDSGSGWWQLYVASRLFSPANF
jgi:hypothetical protein